MNWKSFEEVVKYIYENIGLKSGLTIEGYGSKCIVKGKSGVSHQIDVLFSHYDGVHKYLTAIECKYWNSKVNKDIIMKMQSTVEDCNFDKGIIVSRYGFTASTIQYAKHYNIGLVELREPNELDPELLKNRMVINLKLKITAKCYEITNLKIIPSENVTNKSDKKYLDDFCSRFYTTSLKEKFKYLQENLEGKMKRKEVPTGKIDIVILNAAYMQVICEKCFIRAAGRPDKSLQEYLGEAIDRIYETKANEVISTVIEFTTPATFLSQKDFFSTKISKIIVEGRTVEELSESVSQIKNYALMIMKVVFENKRFVLNEDGTVIEQDVIDNAKPKKRQWWKPW